MINQKYLAAGYNILICITAFHCAAENRQNAVVESTNYDSLISLFKEFRDFQQPESIDGVPDFSVDAMDDKYRNLQAYQNRLNAIDPTGWIIPQKSDYLLVRAEMNGYEFQHRVLRPWSIDPGYYNDVISRYSRSGNLPLQGSILSEMQNQLQIVPAILEQAKANLNNFSEIAGDLGTLAVLSLGDTKIAFESLADKLSEHNPELVSNVETVLVAIDDYIHWIEANKSKMTARAGVGKENYNWLLKNVYLFPYTWEDVRTIVELEDNRVRTFQRLEENRNRNVSPLIPNRSQKEYRDGIYEAVAHIMNFLDEEEIFSLDNINVPDRYYDSRIDGKGYGLDKPWPEKQDYFFNFSHREAVMENTHELVGHLFDEMRSGNDDRPIRGGRRPYKIGTARGEGFAFALEELLMHAGYLDGRNAHGREIAYEQAAFRTVRALSDIHMHSGDWSYADATQFCIDNAPHGELLEGSHHLWFELDTTLRGVGHHMLMVLGKVQFMKLFRDRAGQLGDDFVLKDFMDEVLATGSIPWSLIRWELTGLDDEVKKLW